MTIETKFKLSQNSDWVIDEWEACDLTGSEKQINWAETLRHNMLSSFAIFTEQNKSSNQIEGLKTKMAEIVKTESSAKFFIDHQSYKSVLRA